MNFQACLALVLAIQLGIVSAASPVIGVVSARGGVRVGDSSMNGSGTLFEGTTVETGRVASDVQLSSGVRMQLGAGSKGVVYRDRLVLERGESQLLSSPGMQDYRVEASSLRVTASEPGSVGRIQLAEGKRVQVAAARGNFRVSAPNGLMLASIAAGRALEFDTQHLSSGASAPSTVAGCLERKDGRYYVTDEVSGVRLELKGGSLDRYSGQRIEVTGTHVPTALASAGAQHVVQVNTVKAAGKNCSSSVAGATAGAAAGSASGSGSAAGTGAAAGAAVAGKAVIAGVVVAAAAAGAAIAVTASDDSSTISR